VAVSAAESGMVFVLLIKIAGTTIVATIIA
jgi:hypothetical protein